MVVILYLLPLLITWVAAVDEGCPTNWIYNDGSCYFFGTSISDSDDARALCKEMNANADLASINSYQENQWVLDTWIPMRTSEYLWIGMKRRPRQDWTDSELQWPDGTSFTGGYITWDDSFPMGGEDRECLLMHDNYPYGRWADWCCYFCPGNFVCEAPAPQEVTCPDGFVQLEALPGACYGAVMEPLTAFEAQQVCQSYGGDLADIGDISENAVVVAYLKEYINLGDYPGPTLSHFWLGLHRDISDSWVWNTGEDMSFANWAPGQPNNDLGEQHCAAIMPGQDYQWDDVPCSQTLQEIHGNTFIGAALCKIVQE